MRSFKRQYKDINAKVKWQIPGLLLAGINWSWNQWNQFTLLAPSTMSAFSESAD